LIRLLPIDEKHEFINGHNSKRACTGDGTHSFKPELNKKSLEMANNNRARRDRDLSSVGSNSMIGGYTNAKSGKNCHGDYSKCKPVHDELEECTFHPKINKYMPAKSHYE
jgi:hypothetical protein